MKDYIRSKDYRKFMEENNVRLSDWDKATLIYNASGMSHTDKIFALLEVKKRTEDQKLQSQIKERLDKDHRFCEEYEKSNGNAYWRKFGSKRRIRYTFLVIFWIGVRIRFKLS